MQDLRGLQDAYTWARADAAAEPSSRPPAETTNALVISQLLSPLEIAECHAAAADSGASSPFAGGGLSDSLSELPHDVAYSDEHIAVYLHKNSFFQQSRTALSNKLLLAMRSQPGDWGDPGLALCVRCIEFHRYEPEI